jgi:hypothetical protein
MEAAACVRASTADHDGRRQATVALARLHATAGSSVSLTLVLALAYICCYTEEPALV